MKRLFTLFKKNQESFVLVSGLPRSGTSMMMKMLEAGGIPPLTDEIRTADDDNPKGYYEFERAKKLREGDTAWLPQAAGKAVKTISALLEYLPPEYRYKIIFMRRSMPEILASQKNMLVNRGEDTAKVDDSEMSRLFEAHLDQVLKWLEAQSNIEVLYVSYNEIISNPDDQVEQINRFLGERLNTSAMINVVDPKLYRKRKDEQPQ